MEFITDFWPWLILVFAIVSVGGYGLFSHAVKHTDGTDDIQTADGGQKGLMSRTHHTDIETLKSDLNTAEADLEGFPDELKSLSPAQCGILGAAVEWTAWVPTLTGGADLSGYDVARYFRIGKLCYFYFTAENKNITSSGGSVIITLPFTPVSAGWCAVTGFIHDGTDWVGYTQFQIQPGAANLYVAKTAGAGSWAGTETGVYLRLSGFFEIA